MQKNEAENDAVLDAGDPLAAILRRAEELPAESVSDIWLFA